MTPLLSGRWQMANKSFRSLPIERAISAEIAASDAPGVSAAEAFLEDYVREEQHWQGWRVRGELAIRAEMERRLVVRLRRRRQP